MWSSISASSVMVGRMIKESALVRYSIVSAAKTMITAVMQAAALSSCIGAVRCVGPRGPEHLGKLSAVAALCRLTDHPRYGEVRFLLQHAIRIGHVTCKSLFPLSEHLVPVRPRVDGLVAAIHRERT